MTPEELAAAAYMSDVAKRLAEFRVRVHLLQRIARNDVDAIAEAVLDGDDRGTAAAASEYEALSPEEQEQLARVAERDLRGRIISATRSMWSLAERLGLDPSSLDPDHIALTAAFVMSIREMPDEGLSDLP